MKKNSYNFSKHEKYKTKNPISRKLVEGFYCNLIDLFQIIPNEKIKKILDAGCGEGFISYAIHQAAPKKDYYAFDISEEELNDAKKLIPFSNIFNASIYEIPIQDESVDLVTCCEVLEHLSDPELALKEIYRVTKSYAILTVPKEPIWRILNMARLKYLKNFGNTPDHCNHWSAQSFRFFVSSKFKIIDERHPLPWTQLLCEKL